MTVLGTQVFLIPVQVILLPKNAQVTQQRNHISSLLALGGDCSNQCLLWADTNKIKYRPGGADLLGPCLITITCGLLKQ